MSAFVNSLHRLYNKGSKCVTDEYLQSLLKEGKISQDEYDYIISPL